MKNQTRKKIHQRRNEVEDVLHQLSSLIGPVEEKATEHIPPLTKPVFFIVGTARSGSTIISQYLSKTGFFSYPSNLISRFYYAPYIGSLVHKLFIDFDNRGELFKENTERSYKSDLGKTTGAVAPNEFWYFWRRFFKFGDIQKLSSEELDQVDKATFLKELSTFEYVFDKPLVLKGMILNWNLSYLAKICPNAHFIYVKRDTAYNAQSLLKARTFFFGDTKKWYSFKPPEYDSIKDKSPVEQVVRQVQYTNQAIEKELSLIPTERSIQLSYSDFCANPKQLLNWLLMKSNLKMDTSSLDEQQFKNGNTIKVSEDEWKAILDAI